MNTGKHGNQRSRFTPRDLVQATLLRAYYDGRHDQARARMGHPEPTGLDNPPDDAMVERLLHDPEDEDAHTLKLRARALTIAESVLVALGLGTP